MSDPPQRRPGHPPSPEQHRLPTMPYGRSGTEGTGRAVFGALAGSIGYLMMAAGCLLGAQVTGQFLFNNYWLLLPVTLLPPLISLLLLARWLNLPTMAIAAWITFGVMALTCGTCFAIISF